MPKLQEYEATGAIKKGKLILRNRRALKLALKAFSDCEVAVRIERRRANRSQPQNRWYWGCIVQALSDHTGYSPDEMHAVLKAKFIPKRLAVTDGNGEICGEFVIGGSTAKLDKTAFAEYCEAIRQWAAELGVAIPDPNYEAHFTGSSR